VCHTPRERVKAAQQTSEEESSDFEPTSDAWYNHHFSVAMKFAPDIRTKPPNVLAQLAPQFVEELVPRQLRRDPLDFTLLDHADEGIINSCLQLYIARVNARWTNSPFGLFEARGEFIKDTPGTKALSALSRFGCSEHTASPDRVRLYQSIAHCLVAENNEQALWQWGRDASPSGAPTTDPVWIKSKQRRWRQYLMRSMVDAQIHWTPNSDFTADALATMVARQRRCRLGDKRLAFQRLVQLLFVSSVTCKDVSLYEDFRFAVGAMFKEASPTRRYVVQLDLSHPTRPSADSYLQFLRNDAGTDEMAQYISKMFDPKSIKEATGLVAWLYQLIRVCLVTGKRDDAIWVLDFAYKHRPQLFGSAAHVESYTRALEKVHGNREIAFRRRKATEEEIRKGLAVDESGFLKLTPQMKEAIRRTVKLNEVVSGRDK
jgi:hypothetical protein